MEKLDALCMDIVKILLDEIRGNGNLVSITYGQLAERLIPKINPRNLDHPLGQISDFCKDNDMPLLSTVVVNQDNLLPGDGYFKYYFSNAKADQYKKIFLEQKKYVVDFDWTKLSKILGI